MALSGANKSALRLHLCSRRRGALRGEEATDFVDGFSLGDRDNGSVLALSEAMKPLREDKWQSSLLEHGLRTRPKKSVLRLYLG